MPWASVSITEHSLTQSVAQAADQLLEALGGREPDLLIVFVSSHHRNHFGALPGLLRREFEHTQIVGSLGVSVIGAGHESGDSPAIAMIGALLPAVELQAVHLEQNEIPPLYAERRQWDEVLHLTAQQPAGQLLLTDPFTFNTDALLKALDRQYPETVKLGGLASGLEEPGMPSLLLNDKVYHSGAVCLSLSGDIEVDTIVAQGCRPIGEPMFANVTHDNLILQLDGKIPREILTSLYEKIDRTDRKLFTEALFLGIAMRAQQSHYAQGDYLIRTILGLDPDTGALLVNTPIPAQSVVQLHVRDARTATQDLEQQLNAYHNQHASLHDSGVLLFSCVGRGAEFYGHADHDSNAFKHLIGELPIAGFFCNGEIGAVNRSTFLHGYTSVFGVFRSKTKAKIN